MSRVSIPRVFEVFSARSFLLGGGDGGVYYHRGRYRRKGDDDDDDGWSNRMDEDRRGRGV